MGYDDWQEQPNRKEPARPPRLTSVFNRKTSEKGWLWIKETNAQGAQDFLDSFQAQERLSSNGTSWVRVLDMGREQDDVFVVFEVQDHSILSLIQFVNKPSPQEMSRLAVGLVNILIDLEEQEKRMHGGLSPSTIFFRSNSEGMADLDSPILGQLPPAPRGTDRARRRSDAYSLGLIFYQFAQGVDKPERDLSRVPDEVRLFGQGIGKRMEVKWRKFINSLLAEEFDERPLTELRAAIPPEKVKIGRMPKILASVAVVAIVAVLAVIIDRNRKPLPPNPPPPIPPVVITTNPHPFLTRATVERLKSIARRMPFDLKNEITLLPEDLTETNNFLVFSNAVSEAWMYPSAIPPPPVGAPPSLGILFQAGPNSPLPAMDDSLPDKLEKEFQRRTNLGDLASRWASRREQLEKRFHFADWKDPLPDVHELVWRAWAAFLESDGLNRDRQAWTAALAKDDSPFTTQLDDCRLPAIFLADLNYLPPPVRKTDLDNIEQIVKKQTLKDLKSWITSTSEEIALYRPSVNTSFASLQPKFLQRLGRLANALGTLNSFSAASPVTETQVEQLSAKQKDLADGVKNGGQLREALESQDRQLSLSLENDERLVQSSAVKFVEGRRSQFLSESSANIEPVISKLNSFVKAADDFLDPEDLRGRADKLENSLLPVYGDLRAADEDFKKGHYDDFTAKVTAWNELEKSHLGFIALFKQEQAEAEVFAKFTNDVALKRWKDATHQLTRLQDASATNKPAWKELLKQMIETIAAAQAPRSPIIVTNKPIVKTNPPPPVTPDVEHPAPSGFANMDSNQIIAAFANMDSNQRITALDLLFANLKKLKDNAPEANKYYDAWVAPLEKEFSNKSSSPVKQKFKDIQRFVNTLDTF